MHVIGLHNLKSLLQAHVPHANEVHCEPFWRAKKSLDCTYTGPTPAINSDDMSAEVVAQLQPDGTINVDVIVQSNASRILQMEFVDDRPIKIIRLGSQHPFSATSAAPSSPSALRMFKRDAGSTQFIARFNAPQNHTHSNDLRLTLYYDEWLDGSCPALDEVI